MKTHHVKSLEIELEELRRMLAIVANNITKMRNGHTPSWKDLLEMIEKYEDDYCGLEDER